MTSPVVGFSIPHGNMLMTVEDTSKPIWFGDYYHGKLAIYVATVTGEVIPDSITLICVMMDGTGKDYVMSSHYLNTFTLDEIVSDLQARVIIRYNQEKSKEDPALWVNGPSTLQ
jgi:hypothetical protein